MSKFDPYYHLLPFAILFFFANNFLLPEGLLYTAILSPVLLYYIYREGDLKTLMRWGILFLIPIPFHIAGGFDINSYLVSTALVFTALVFFAAAIRAVQNSNKNLEEIFTTIIIINAVLVFIALLVLPFGSIRDVFWYDVPISPDIPGFPRLKLLAYEPSHYALLLSPVFFYFILKVATGQSKHPLIAIAAVGLPILLSLSFGVIGSMGLALIIGSIIYLRKLPKIYGSYTLYSGLFIVAILVFIWIIWPTNPVYTRIGNILAGEDTSARGRLFNSFWFAYDLIKTHNFFMGVGPGQVKILAHDMIINYYNYSGDYAEIVRIPNSMGEILAVYGIYGFILKLVFEIYFFVRLKIYNNLYTLVLFLFIFIYQFTGSFVINVAELGIWAIVFNAKLSRFNISSLKTESS